MSLVIRTEGLSVQRLRRYPVKSMLGEELDRTSVDPGGLAGDRELAVLDTETGMVATAKHPRLWRRLLHCRAGTERDGVHLVLADGRSLPANDAEVHAALSTMLQREVTLSAQRPVGASVGRPDPEEVMAHGADADLPYLTLEIAQGTPGSTFVDLAPVHLITTATLDHLALDAIRYRPNIVLRTPAGTPPYVENDWVGRELTVGGVRLRGIVPTPRCAVPTLEHGELPIEPRAVRPLLRENRVEVLDLGPKPCAGLYAEVLSGGELRVGDGGRLD